MAIVDRQFSSIDFCRFAGHAKSLRANMSKLLKFGVISLAAAAIAGCAQDPAPRDIAVDSAQARTAPPSAVAPGGQRTEHSYIQARIRRLGPTLLKPQPAPNCEYKRSDIKTVDAEEWVRLKTEFELRCYRDAEKATRTRLGLLQSSVRHLQD